MQKIAWKGVPTYWKVQVAPYMLYYVATATDLRTSLSQLSRVKFFYRTLEGSILVCDIGKPRNMI